MMLYVVIDIGCYECGVDSEPVGVFDNPGMAETARAACDARTNRWRNHGQTFAQVFQMELS